ncbi:MAG: hypothetical protein RIB58_00205 [Phycisphaerales bacterium]
MDWYAFVDEILLQEADRVVTIHRLLERAPYFRDHFPGRPVLPGVLATEAMVQAGRLLLGRSRADAGRWVLGSARALRFSRFLSPGQWLVCDVRLKEASDDRCSLAASCLAAFEAPTDASALDTLETAVSGRLVLRRAILAGATSGSGAS